MVSYSWVNLIQTEWGVLYAIIFIYLFICLFDSYTDLVLGYLVYAGSCYLQGEKTFLRTKTPPIPWYQTVSSLSPTLGWCVSLRGALYAFNKL